MDKAVEFRYGAFGGAIEEQANEQGYTLGKEAEKLEKIRKSINMLGFHGYLPDGQVKKLFDKLHKQIMKSLQESEVKNGNAK